MAAAGCGSVARSLQGLRRACAGEGRTPETDNRKQVMITAMIAIFALGYLCIALEHRLKIDKVATALVMCGVLWTLFALRGGDGGLGDALAGHLGSTCEILVFLIGAMAIVGLIDACGGFAVVTRRIAVRGKRRLLWLLALVAFFMSAVLDNMTTAIVMVTLLRALVPDRDERWLCASVIVIAANSGGAWSPIGDVTTIMLWMNDNVTAWPLMRSLLLPCLVSTVIPVLLASRGLRGTFPAPAAAAAAHAGKRIATADAPTRRSARTSAAGNGRNPGCGKADAAARAEAAARRRSLLFLAAGVAGLLFVPLFRSLTGLPPYMGMMIALGVLWALSEWMNRRVPADAAAVRMPEVLRRVDLSTILFFLGILMAVGALESAGLLRAAAQALDRGVHEVFAVAGAIGLLSSVIDNVPLVAACMGMYPVADAATVAAGADAAYRMAFVADGLFWRLLSFCAGTGGSLLIIGSAAGVVVMGIERITFAWYLRRIAWLALAGYVAGMALIWIERLAGF